MGPPAVARGHLILWARLTDKIVIWRRGYLFTLAAAAHFARPVAVDWRAVAVRKVLVPFLALGLQTLHAVALGA